MTTKRTAATRPESDNSSTKPDKVQTTQVNNPLEIPSAIPVTELAAMMHVDPIDIIKQLMRFGFMITINEVVEYDIAASIAKSLGFAVKDPHEDADSLASVVLSHDDESADDLVTRPPVVTILGHVDHGKTTLLDSIRSSKVVDAESGGITQHIGAYQVEYNDQTISFLDTPGHEAFTAMRARGAQVTDIAILVVAADDGIMPQTQEAIDHVKAANVPIIVAINKIDRPEADVDRVRRQLSERDLLVEEWGGEVIGVPVSALKNEGVGNLLENVLLVSELAELKANPNRPAKGVVIEAHIDRSRGPISTILVQTGTLSTGDIMFTGGFKGRVRAMTNEYGHKVESAGPSAPVAVMGVNGLPQAGDTFEIVQTDRDAKALVEEWGSQQYSDPKRSSLEDFSLMVEAGNTSVLNLIVKTDVQGSMEALRSALDNLNTDATRVSIISMSTGTITESDVMLASASDAIIVGFNTHSEPGAYTLASQEGVDIRSYDIIYNLIDDVTNALRGLLAPTLKDVMEGYATVRATFGIGRRGIAAGVYVNNGIISRGGQIHVIRSGETIYEGTIESLKHFKDDVRELANGTEGGIVIAGFQDYVEGDVLESHRIEETEA